MIKNGKLHLIILLAGLTSTFFSNHLIASLEETRDFSLTDGQGNKRYSRVSGTVVKSGAFGTVEIVTFPGDSRDYALKTMEVREGVAPSPYSVEMFKHEAQVLKRLDHPNIIKIFGAFGLEETAVGQLKTTPSAPYLVMERASGESLEDLIAKRCNGPPFPPPGFSEEEIQEIYFQAVDALFYLHEHGLIHRDIKPENIMVDIVDINGRKKVVVKIIDFGLSIRVGVTIPKEKAVHLIINAFESMTSDNPICVGEKSSIYYVQGQDAAGTVSYTTALALQGIVHPASDLTSLALTLGRLFCLRNSREAFGRESGIVTAIKDTGSATFMELDVKTLPAWAQTVLLLTGPSDEVDLDVAARRYFHAKELLSDRTVVQSPSTSLGYVTLLFPDKKSNQATVEEALTTILQEMDMGGRSEDEKENYYYSKMENLAERYPPWRDFIASIRYFSSIHLGKKPDQDSGDKEYVQECEVILRTLKKYYPEEKEWPDFLRLTKRKLEVWKKILGGVDVTDPKHTPTKELVSVVTVSAKPSESLERDSMLPPPKKRHEVDENLEINLNEILQKIETPQSKELLSNEYEYISAMDVLAETYPQWEKFIADIRIFSSLHLSKFREFSVEDNRSYIRACEDVLLRFKEFYPTEEDEPYFLRFTRKKLKELQKLVEPKRPATL